MMQCVNSKASVLPRNAYSTNLNLIQQSFNYSTGSYVSFSIFTIIDVRARLPRLTQIIQPFAIRVSVSKTAEMLPESSVHQQSVCSPDFAAELPDYGGDSGGKRGHPGMRSGQQHLRHELRRQGGQAACRAVLGQEARQLPDRRRLALDA
eukprot:scaffold47719_cov42-Prasinocladus_malaysianus.AAC.1